LVCASRTLHIDFDKANCLLGVIAFSAFSSWAGTSGQFGFVCVLT
jgi:hypothetical protein